MAADSEASGTAWLTRLRPLVLAGLIGWGAAAGAAGVEPRAFGSPEEEARYRELIAELRCLVCQNQSLAESDADLARDLRDETHEMLRAGKTDQEIVDFMVGRYGDFVLYRPPVRSTTALLWFGPALLVAAGAVLMLVQVRRKARQPEAADLTPEDERKARELLAGGGEKP